VFRVSVVYHWLIKRRGLAPTGVYHGAFPLRKAPVHRKVSGAFFMRGGRFVLLLSAGTVLAVFIDRIPLALASDYSDLAERSGSGPEEGVRILLLRSNLSWAQTSDYY
jgi:hypothetical protein